MVDLACGEIIPEEIVAALLDENVTKWAFNAQFERICLSAYMRKYYPQYFYSYSIPEDFVGNYLDPHGWKCSMVWSAYMGLSLSLKSVGEVLKLSEQKMDEGKALIRYFSVPCNPTKPEHDPAKWELFKTYNKRDVEVEMAIQHKLRNFSVPDMVWEEYWLDQEINDRGIALDMDVVENAIRIDAASKDRLSESLQELTGLENPNSAAQMKDWLSEKGMPMESIGKKEVAAAMETAPEDIARVLELRQQLAKSSVSKYQAMQNAVCNDGRERGMFMFYGANRTGRFSGRIIQLQNLPQNHMPDLSQARELVKAGDMEMLEILYDNIPMVLSELIRTAFVPKQGYKFVVADFSAIEARVIAYLAGESWR